MPVDRFTLKTVDQWISDQKSRGSAGRWKLTATLCPGLTLRLSVTTRAKTTATWYAEVKRGHSGGRRTYKNVGTYPDTAPTKAITEWHNVSGRKITTQPDSSRAQWENLRLEYLRATAKLGGLTLADLCEKYFDENALVTEKETRRLLDSVILSQLGDVQADCLETRQIHEILRMRARNSPYVADRAHRTLNAVYNTGLSCGYLLRSENPCTPLRPYATPKSRDRTLSFAELTLVLECFISRKIPGKDAPISAISCDMALFTIATGLRRCEVSGLMRQEIAEQWATMEKATRLELTRDAPKMEGETRSFLGPLALAVIARQPESDRWLWCSSRRAGDHVKGVSLTRFITRFSQSLVAAGLIEETFSVHDLRRTYRSRLAQLGVADHVAEMAMGHSMKGYNRERFADEIAAAVTLYGEKLAELCRGQGLTDEQIFRETPTAPVSRRRRARATVNA